MKKILPFLLILFFCLNCAPSPVDIENMLAQTQAARSTPTLLPKPTNTTRPQQPPSSSSSSSSTSTSWFEGGTLHRSTVAQWRSASYTNRLATSADFVAATQDVDFGNLSEFKKMATDLEICISEAVSGGDVDDELVSYISALCSILLWP